MTNLAPLLLQVNLFVWRKWLVILRCNYRMRQNFLVQFLHYTLLLQKLWICHPGIAISNPYEVYHITYRFKFFLIVWGFIHSCLFLTNLCGTSNMQTYIFYLFLIAKFGNCGYIEMVKIWTTINTNIELKFYRNSTNITNNHKSPIINFAGGPL